MSAESPRRSRVGGPLVVAPQPPSDRSLMDTVSGFISDVTLTSTPGLDPKDVIQWARLESAELDEGRGDTDGEGDPPLLLIVGYGAGVQVWAIHPGGEAQEVLSWRQGSVRVLRILPNPNHSQSDHYHSKRPLVGLCDSAGPGIPYCSLSFISLTGGDQVKSIKFKNPILDVVANRRSIVVSFSERLAVFDACTLEDRLTVTTCYPAPCPLGGTSPVNPIALGDRWLAYAERRLSPTKRSNGGCEGEGVASYTATVLHAAKSLGKGLRGLGESVASSLGGTRVGGLSQSPSPPNTEHLQPGVVTVLDIEGLNPNDEEEKFDEDNSINNINESVVAHFIAHSESIIALKFDASGMILVTADKRGHDFHVFRIHPHPSGPNLASVHHLYILHRGDTTAKVQDISISLDCRWTAVSTLRGTTHVFPITPYGGAVGVRTHASSHVVNRLSRFHRSAGLAADGRSSSPVGENLVNSAWYPNPRLPPFPVPCSQSPLAQLRPMPPAGTIPTHTITRNSSGRQRLSSVSEEGQAPLAVCSRWGSVRATASGPTARTTRGSANVGGAMQALYVMSAHGYLIQYHINPKHLGGIPKEKVCDDTAIELDVEARVQWPLLRPLTSHDIMAPLTPNNILIRPIKFFKKSCDKNSADIEDRWLSQVEIMTHAGPHRRLWMGPQFVFKTYNASSGTSLSLLDSEAVEVGTGPAVARSNPVNMPGARPIVPVLIESGSASSLEHSPRLSDAFRKQTSSACIIGDSGEGVPGRVGGEGRLKEDLAEAMREADQGCEWTLEDWSKREDVRCGHVHRIVNPLGTVVSGASSESPSPPGEKEEDSYIMSNEDEALFRPVVSAPRSLPAPETPPTRPLSTNMLLPVQRLSPPSSTDDITPTPAVTLTDRVVIPARLTLNQLSDSNETKFDDSTSNVQFKSEIIVKQCNEPKVHPENDNAKSSFVKSSKKKVKDKKKEDKTKVVAEQNKNLPKGIEKLNNKECEVSLSMETYVEEISKAVDNIEYFNDESICNDSVPVINCSRSNSCKVSSFTDNEAIGVSPVTVCTDTLHENLDIFDDIEDNKVKITSEMHGFADWGDSISEPVVDSKIKVSAKKGSKSKTIDKEKTNRLSEESAWELLSGVDNLSINKSTVNDKVDLPEVQELNSDENKMKKKKIKPPKQRYNFTPKFENIESDSTKECAVKEDLDSDFVVSEKPKPSWSSIASTKKYPDVDSLNSDESSYSKVSTVYNRNNIVLALCDTPKSELCFVEEHHSMFMEPPPLEPLDLILDEQKIQEMHDSFLDYTHTSTVSNDFSFDAEEFSRKFKCSPEFQISKETFKEREDRVKTDFINVNYKDSDSDAKCKGDMDHLVDDNIKQCEEKLIVLMEKSSDEENVSPSSSQTESDDCTNMATSENNFLMENQPSAVVEEPLSFSMQSAATKSSKKKPKRKRR